MFLPIKKEIREQILFRIKNEGVSVSQAAKDHGVSTKTIYGWLSKEAEKAPSVVTVNRLQNENKQLYQIIGRLTAEVNRLKKGGLWK